MRDGIAHEVGHGQAAEHALRTLDATSTAIAVRGLVKEFVRGRRTLVQAVRRQPDRRERFRAVDGIDLDVPAGEIFGILGPNGAGKTTTLRMLSTLLEPSGGTASVLGFDVHAQPREVRRRLGAAVAGERSLYWKLTARENLEYFAALHGIPSRRGRARIDEMLRAVQLDERADDFVERFSTGMRQRLVLARALLSDPPVLLLDEPTLGLDPQAASDLRDRVRALRSEGRTILLTTHYLDEADQLCDHIAIIDHGRIVAMGTPNELRAHVGADRLVRLRLAGGETAVAFAELAGQFGRVIHRADEPERLELVAQADDPAAFIASALRLADSVGARVAHVEIVSVSLEEVFLTITGRALRE
ncbi:MAG TPA: ABC transporter ATP-binding protein [Candidatus Dormibacteraeota bacterium]